VHAIYALLSCFLSLYCYVIVSLNEINIGCKKKAKVGGPAKPKVIVDVYEGDRCAIERR